MSGAYIENDAASRGLGSAGAKSRGAEMLGAKVVVRYGDDDAALAMGWAVVEEEAIGPLG